MRLRGRSRVVLSRMLSLQAMLCALVCYVCVCVCMRVSVSVFRGSGCDFDCGCCFVCVSVCVRCA